MKESFVPQRVHDLPVENPGLEYGGGCIISTAVAPQTYLFEVS